MKDNDLIRLFRPIIINGLIELGYSGVNVLQANQPTQQGVPTSPSIFFYKIGNKRYGFLQREDTWDKDTGQMVHTETQFQETTFQVSALVLQNINSPNAYTASDLVNDVAAIMQSDKTRDILRAADVAILRVMDIRNPYFTDDRDQFEASPSFDFVLTHRQVIVSESEIIDGVDFKIYNV